MYQKIVFKIDDFIDLRKSMEKSEHAVTADKLN